MQVTWQLIDKDNRTQAFDIHQVWGEGWVSLGFRFWRYSLDKRAFCDDMGTFTTVQDGKAAMLREAGVKG